MADSETMSLVDAIEYIRNDEAHAAALAGLQEVREVLEALAIRRHIDHTTLCWCEKRWDATKPHEPACQRARELMKRLTL